MATIKILGLGQDLLSNSTVTAASVKAIKDLIDTKQDTLTFSTGLTNTSNTITLNKATTSALGGVIVPTSGNLTVDSNGNISVASASTSGKGVIEIADGTEFAAGTATDLAVTPAQVASGSITLTNKSINANNNTITNLGTSNIASGSLVTSLASTVSTASDVKLATEKAIVSGLVTKIGLTDLSATAPITYNNTTGVIAANVDTTVGTHSAYLVTSGAVESAIASALTGALTYRGTWTATNQTDYSGITLPVKKGYLYLVQGSATIGGVSWNSGDHLIINKDVAAGGTITSSDVDKVDNTENPDAVYLNSTQTLTNKTIDADDNTIKDLGTSNFKSGVVQTSIRSSSTAVNSALLSEKAIVTALEGKQDNLTFSTGLTESSGTVSVTIPVASLSGNSGKILTNNGTATSWVDQKTYSAGTGIDITSDTITNTSPNIQSDWNASTAAEGAIKNKPTLATVATSGNYTDLNGYYTFGSGLSVSSGNEVTVTNPVPASFPAVSGNNGKFLTTNGTTLSWATPQDTKYTFSTGLTESSGTVTLNAAGASLGGVKSGGSNISIAADGTISATDTTYSQGTGITITGTTISNSAPNIQSDWTATTAANGSIKNKPTFSTGLTYNNNILTVSVPVASVSSQSSKVLTNDGSSTSWGDLNLFIGTVASSAPSGATSGDTYYDTGTKKIYTYDGSSWGSATTPTKNRSYVAKDTHYTYIWDGTDLIQVGGSDDLPSQSGQSGKFLTTDGTDVSWATVDALPSQTSQSGKFLTTNGTTASWATVDALPSQTSQSGKFLTTNGTTASWANVPTEIPSQSGQSGKYLTTNGSTVSWASVPSNLPSQSGQSGKFLTTDGTDASWGSLPAVDQTYSGTSTNAQSGVAVKSAIDSALSSVYKPAGSIAFASLPTPASTNLGNVYNMTDAFTTDSRFVEGAGKSYPAGTNVVIVDIGSSTYKFDVLAGFVDLSGYQTTITGAATTITSSNLTASKALVSDTSGKVAVSSVTSTELGYVSGVTSAIQTQLNNKVTGNSAITGATKCKITYDSKGLVTSGSDLASSDVTTALGYTPVQYAMVITDYTAS